MNSNHIGIGTTPQIVLQQCPLLDIALDRLTLDLDRVVNPQEDLETLRSTPSA